MNRERWEWNITRVRIVVMSEWLIMTNHCTFVFLVLIKYCCIP